MSSSEFFYAGVESALNRYLDLDPVARERLDRLHGKVIAIDVRGLGLSLFLIPGPGRLMVSGGYEGQPDCRLRGAPLALARMANRQRNSEQLFSGEVAISGDTELAHRFGNILADMDVDWEEQLSKVTGDGFAHGAGELVRDLLGWGRQTAGNLGMDVQEYLQEEIRILPNRIEVEEFLEEVDKVRDDGERLEARIRRLERRLTEGADS
jgi:ubiquinone biosynthesis protein UbiJ